MFNSQEQTTIAAAAPAPAAAANSINIQDSALVISNRVQTVGSHNSQPQTLIVSSHALGTRRDRVQARSRSRGADVTYMRSKSRINFSKQIERVDDGYAPYGADRRAATTLKHGRSH